jgi:hypothetical protein
VNSKEGKKELPAYYLGGGTKEETESHGME